MARFTDPDEARSYLASLSAHADRPGDTSKLNPEFAVRAANAISQARDAGLQVGLLSGYREGSVTGSRYDMGGFSSHGYGLASDFSGIGTAGSKTAQQWNQIAQANGLHNPYLGTKAEGKEWNHWQLPEKPLEQMPDQLAALRKAKASGDINQVWAASQPFISSGTAVASAPTLAFTPYKVAGAVQPPPASSTTINASSAPVAGALSKPAAAPAGGGFMTSVANIESNDSNIPSTVDKDYPGQPGSKSQGHWQIDTPTWRQFGAQAGIDLTKYPNAMSAPRDVQEQVARQIPLGRFGGRTIKLLNKQYGTNLDKTQTLGALDAKYGGTGGVAPGATAAVASTGDSAPAAAPTTTATAAPAAPAEQPWYASLTKKPDSGGKSPMEAAVAAFTGAPEKAKQVAEDQAPESVKNEAGPAPPARNVSPGLQNIQQTYGNTLNSFMQPLTWTSAPPGGPQMPAAGLQMAAATQIPGISLNSVLPSPQGLGYGINPVGYGFG